ncbi:MAG TPA: hypothetical protein VHZ96_18840 [Frankiaceae bacterium]|nr:hypothetical protein [Frankiaceae bacterium]
MFVDDVDQLDARVLARKLDSGLSTLAALTGLPHWRTLNVPRAAQRTIADLAATLRSSARHGLTPAEEHTLTAALAALRTPWPGSIRSTWSPPRRAVVLRLPAAPRRRAAPHAPR